MTKSLPGPANVSLSLAPPLMKSWPSPPIMMSSPGPASMASLPGPPLSMSAPSRSVMMSLPSPPRATSSPPLPSMTSLPCRTPEGVVVVAAEDAVDAGGAVVDGLAVDAGRVDGVACPVGDRAVGHAHEQQALVAVGRRRVVGDDEAVAGRNRLPSRPRLASWNLQSAVAKASAFSELVPSVLRWISSENELPSSWVRRFMPGVRAR